MKKMIRQNESFSEDSDGEQFKAKRSLFLESNFENVYLREQF